MFSQNVSCKDFQIDVIMVACALGLCCVITLGQVDHTYSHAQELPTPNQHFRTNPIVLQLDFDEQHELHLALPQILHRYVSSEEGFPPFGEVKVVHTAENHANRALQLGLADGSISVRSDPFQIPAWPGTDYEITARVKTMNVTHSGAFLRAWWCDESGKLVHNSVTTSTHVQTHGKWQTLEFQIHANESTNRFLALELLAAQPEQTSNPDSSTDMIQRHDVTGSVLFDDVTVRVIPQITLRVGEDVPVFRQPNPIPLTAGGTWPVHSPLFGHITVRDINSETVFETHIQLEVGTQEQSLRLPVSKCGWYQVQFELFGNNADSQFATAAFVVFPEFERRTHSRTSRFGLRPSTLSHNHSPAVELLRMDATTNATAQHNVPISISSEVSECELISELTLAILQEWRDNSDVLLFDAPWKEHSSIGNSFVPTPAFSVLRTVAEQLNDRQFVEEISIPHTSTAWILRGRNENDHAMIVWGKSSGESSWPATLMQFRRDSLLVTDIFGNRSSMQDANSNDNVIHVEYPIFVENIDLKLIQFVSRIAIEPDYVQATPQPHIAEISLSNPFDVEVTGQFQFDFNSNWEIDPRTQTFAIPAQERARFNVTLQPVRDILAGSHKLGMKLSMQARQSYDIHHSIEIEAGLPNIQVSADWKVEKNVSTDTQDAIVTIHVTNVGSEPVNLDVYVLAEGIEQRMKTISRLAARQKVTRTIRIPFIPDDKTEQEVNISIVDRRTLGRLNQVVLISDQQESHLRANTTAAVGN